MLRRATNLFVPILALNPRGEEVMSWTRMTCYDDVYVSNAIDMHQYNNMGNTNFDYGVNTIDDTYVFDSLNMFQGNNNNNNNMGNNNINMGNIDGGVNTDDDDTYILNSMDMYQGYYNNNNGLENNGRVFRMNSAPTQHAYQNLENFKIGKAEEDSCTDSSMGSLCCICLDEMISSVGSESKEIAMPHCSHVFHYRCIIEWLSISNTCPLCRTPVQIVD